MKYSYSSVWTGRTRGLAQDLGFTHIQAERIAVIESTGSKARRTLARIHGMGKAMQEGLQQTPFYTIELVTEKFNKLSEEEKIKTLIHELLHIPQAFGGGLLGHRHHVTHANVEEHFRRYLAKQKNG